MAGLWKNIVCNDLLWRADHFASLTKPSKYRAPSWSWASLDRGINNNPRDAKDFAPLVDSSITPAGLDPAGEVSDGWLLMRGLFGHFSRLNSGGLISDMTQKLDISNNMGKVIGGAF